MIDYWSDITAGFAHHMNILHGIDLFIFLSQTHSSVSCELALPSFLSLLASDTQRPDTSHMSCSFKISWSTPLSHEESSTPATEAGEATHHLDLLWTKNAP